MSEMQPIYPDHEEMTYRRCARALAGEVTLTKDEAQYLERVQGFLGQEFWSRLLSALVRKPFPVAEAERHWNGLLAHRDALNEALQRPVGLDVAALDYFKNIVGLLGEVVVMEAETLLDLVQDALRDDLTDLYDRGTMMSLLRRMLEQADRYHHFVAVVLLDLDHFKQVNDTKGHLFGDYVLQELACLLRRAVRRWDRAARYGGEEFALLLPETNARQAFELAERLRKQVEQYPFRLAADEDPLSITISAGIAAYPQHAEQLTELFDRADEALYHAKAEGRNRVCIWGEDFPPDRRGGAA